jgi:hypothetical protein
MLNRWSSIMQVEPWLFNQITGAGAPLNEREVWVQYERQIVAEGLLDAFDELAEAAGYYFTPVWVVGEKVTLGRGVPWQFQQLRTRWGYVQEFGVRTTAVIDAAAAVTYSAVTGLLDSSGVALEDTATITATGATGIDPDEIQVFFQTSDLSDDSAVAADPRYRIDGLKVSVSGDTVTMTGHKALFVKPSVVWDVPWDTASASNNLEKNAGDTETAADFVTAVDVYRVYTDGTKALMIEDPIFYQGTSLDSDRTTTAVARLLDSRDGVFEARTESGTVTPAIPETVYVNYRAGFPSVAGVMDYPHARAVIRLANARIGTHPSRSLGPFDQPSNNLFHDDNRPPSDENPVVTRDVDNPFGVKAGELAAWRFVKRKKRVWGMAV